MKAFSIVIKDAPISLSAASGYNLPVADGCKAWFFLGESLATSAINWAEGEAGATVVGSPTVSPYYLGLESAINYLELTITDTVDLSYVLVARGTDTYAAGANRPMLIGNHGVGEGADIFLQETGILRFQSRIEHGAGPTNEYNQSSLSIIASPPAQWRCIIGQTSEATQGVWDMTNEESATEAQPSGAVRIPSTSEPIAIGGGGSTTFGGTSDIAMAAVYDRYLTSDERDAIYARLAAHYARRGITI